VDFRNTKETNMIVISTRDASRITCYKRNHLSVLVRKRNNCDAARSFFPFAL